MDWIEGLLTGVLIAIFFTYSNSKSKEKVNKGIEGKYQLKLNASYKWIGIVSIVFGIALLGYGLLSGEEDIFFVAFMIISVFVGLGVIILMWYQNHTLIFDNETITVKSWKGDIKTIKWEEVNKIKFSPIMGYLRVYSKSQKLNIHQHIVGLVEFLIMMEEKTEYRAKDLKLPF